MLAIVPWKKKFDVDDLRITATGRVALVAKDRLSFVDCGGHAWKGSVPTKEAVFSLQEAEVPCNAARSLFLAQDGVVDERGALTHRWGGAPFAESGQRVIALSPDGNRILCAVYDPRSADASVTVVDVTSGKPVGPPHPARTAAFMPDGRLALATYSGRLSIVDFATGKEASAPLSFNVDRGLTVSRDGRWIALLGSRPGEVFPLAVISAETLEQVACFEATRRERRVWRTVFSRSHLFFARDEQITRVDMASWQVTGASTRVTGGCWDVSADGSWMLTLEDDELRIGDQAGVFSEEAKPVPVIAPVKPKPTRRWDPPARRTAAKALLQAGFFAVPASVSVDAVKRAARNLYDILDRQPERFALLVEPYKKGQVLRWFTCMSSERRRYLLEPWVEVLSDSLGELSVALVDDPNEVTLFEHYSGVHRPTLRIIAHRHLVDASVGAVEHVYESTEETSRAKRPTAIDLGVAQVHPSATPHDRFRALQDTADWYIVARDGARLPLAQVRSVPKRERANFMQCLEFEPPGDRWTKLLPADYRRFD